MSAKRKKSAAKLDLLQLIRQARAGMSEAHRLVADYLLDSPESAAFLPVNGLAERIGTSDATLIRFAQELGFKGYKELREHLAVYIQRAVYAQKPSLERASGGGDPLQKIKQLDINYLTRTMDAVDPARFEKLIKQIMAAKRVFCMGWRISSFLAEFTAFQLGRVGRSARAITRERRSLLEQVLDLKAGDLLVVYDLLLYSSEVFEAVSHLRRTSPKVKIVTITNDPMAQIVQYADLSFFLDLSGQSDFSIISLTAPMCFVNALVEEVIAADPQKAKRTLSRYEQVVLSKGHHAMPDGAQG